MFDRGLLYGDAAFETVRVYQGRPFRWEQHRRRLRTTLARLAIPFPEVDLRQATADLLEAAGMPDASVRLTITRGVGEGLAPGPGLTPTVLLIPRAIPEGIQEARARGVAVIRLPFGHGQHGFTTGHKTTDYAAAVQGRILAARNDAFEALYVEQDGTISEATTSNVFCVRRGQLLTPPVGAGCLPGITRELVLQIARRSGIPIRETPLRSRDLGRAEEVFLTGSVIEIVPVVRIDGSPLGAGTPGEITTRLQRAYQRRVAALRKSP